MCGGILNARQISITWYWRVSRYWAASLLPESSLAFTPLGSIAVRNARSAPRCIRSHAATSRSAASAGTGLSLSSTTPGRAPLPK